MNGAFKAYAKTNRVKLWQVAERLGITPSLFSIQYMRHELTAVEDQKLRAIVDEIAKEEKHENEEKQAV